MQPTVRTGLGAAATVLALVGCAQASPASPSRVPLASPSPTPTFHAHCMVDPAGCGYPAAENTGVPPGTVLAHVPRDAAEGDGWSWRGDIRAVVTTEPDAVLDGLRIDDGMVIVFHPGVHISRLRLTSSDHFPINCTWGGETRKANSCLGLVVEDSEIVGLGVDCHTGMGFSGYTARRVEISGCQDGFKANNDVLIEDSYVHDLWYEGDETGSTHNDGVQTTGGSNVTLRHNTFLLGHTEHVNAVVQFGIEDHPTISRWVIEDNLLDGGGHTFNARPPVTDSIVRNNRFTDRQEYGVGDIPDAVWEGNYWDATGQPLPQNA